MVHLLDRHNQRVPAIGAGAEECCDPGAILIEQLAERGLDLRGLDGRERRQRSVRQQLIDHRAGSWQAKKPPF
jgi:hypothetical protein